jgi:hypothetical protein
MSYLLLLTRLHSIEIPIRCTIRIDHFQAVIDGRPFLLIDELSHLQEKWFLIAIF